MSTSNVNENAGSKPGPQAAAARDAVRLCEAHDLKAILADLAGQIADADRRHSQALSAMQERLGLLGLTTQGLRERLPQEMTSVLDRIEGGMAQLSERIAEADSQRRDGSQPSEIGEPQALAAAPVVVEAAPALRSALDADALDAYARRLRTEAVAIDNFDVIEYSGPPRDEDETLDQDVSDSLARLYAASASDEVGAPALDAVTATTLQPAPVVNATDAPAGTLGGGAIDTVAAAETPASETVVGLPANDFAPHPPAPAASAPLIAVMPAPSTAEIATELASELAVLQAKTLTGEREWLERRFAEVAQKLEQKPASGAPDIAAEVIAQQAKALESERQWLTQRFDEVAQRLERVPATPPAPASKGEIAAEVVALQSKSIEGERQWLEQRIAELAVRLEQSLDTLKPGGSLETIEARFTAIEQALASLRPSQPFDTIEARFTTLESKLSEAMGATAQRADLAGLKSIESQVEDLNAHLVTVETHFSRLDSIELELRSLAERLSPGEIGRIIEQKSARPQDSEALAGAVASRVAKELPRYDEAIRGLTERLSTDKLASLVASVAKPAVPDVNAIARMVAEQIGQRLPKPSASGPDPLAVTGIDELKAMLEAFVVEQRHGDEQTTTMLDTMQQAMIRLLDRMDAMEQSRPAAEPPADVVAYREPRRQRAGVPPPDYGVPQRPAEASGRTEALVDSIETRAPAPFPQPREPEPQHPAPVQVQVQVETPPPQSRAAVQSAAADATDDPMAPSLREGYIAAARRAARMAAETPPEPVEAPSESKGPRKAVPREEGGKRLLSKASIALACVLLAGVSFVALKSTVLAPPSPTGRAVAVPAPTAAGGSASPAQSTAEKSLQNLEDADLLDDSARRAAPQGPTNPSPQSPPQPQRRSSLLGQGEEGLGMTGFQTMMGELQQREAAGVPAVPAALTKEPQPGAQPARSEMPPLAIGPNSLRSAAAKGDPSAEFEVGARYAEGRGVPQDLQQAVNWYQRSASQGFAPAQYRLGSMYERGLGVKMDLARARVWYQRAAEQGIVKAMHNLAVLSAGREGTVTDYPAAAKWFRAAADYGLTDSQFNLAIMHDSGLGLERDPKQAFKWFTLAARAGDDEAARRRESLRTKLEPQDLAAVEAEIAGWRPKSADQAINDPRTAGEAWKSRAR